MKLPSVNQRIKDVIDYYCHSNEMAFSKEIGVSQPRINRLFNIDKRSGKYPLPSFEIIQSVINMFVDISPEWLIVGKGEMIKKNSIIEKAEPEELNYYKNKVMELQDKVSRLQDRIIKMQDEQNAIKSRPAPPAVVPDELKEETANK